MDYEICVECINKAAIYNEFQKITEQLEKNLLVIKDANTYILEIMNRRLAAQSDFPGSKDIDESLFAGCNDAESLLRRYRSLMKTFHPDNQNGDNDMTVKIKNTYDMMMKKITGR